MSLAPQPRILRIAAIALALLFGLAPPSSAAEPGEGGRVVVRVEGMTCDGCNAGVTGALESLDFVDEVFASFASKGACARLSGELDTARIAAAVSGAGYTFVSAERVAECPAERRGALPDPWDGRGEGLDVVTISDGAEVDIEAHLAEGRFTIVDFGAPWCGPCHTTAEQLDAYLREHSDVAVRVVNLRGDTAEESYAQPVVAQHLQYVKGIPWFIVYAPDGRVLVRSRDVGKAIAAIDKRRARSAGKKAR